MGIAVLITIQGERTRELTEERLGFRTSTGVTWHKKISPTLVFVVITS